MRAIGYCRVSTAEQGRSGLGLAAQRAAIEQACEQRGWELLWVEDEVRSAAKADNRPVLSSVLAELRDGAADALVVSKLDRLSRSVPDASRLIQEAERRGWNLVALDMGLDLSTPTGRLVAHVLSAVAQFEREVIGQRIADALAVKRASGWEHPNPRPCEDARRRVGILHRRGLSQRAIADALNADGVPSVGERWTRSSVRRVLERL